MTLLLLTTLWCSGGSYLRFSADTLLSLALQFKDKNPLSALIMTMVMMTTRILTSLWFCPLSSFYASSEIIILPFLCFDSFHELSSCELKYWSPSMLRRHCSLYCPTRRSRRSPESRTRQLQQTSVRSPWIYIKHERNLQVSFATTRDKTMNRCAWCVALSAMKTRSCNAKIIGQRSNLSFHGSSTVHSSYLEVGKYIVLRA